MTRAQVQEPVYAWFCDNCGSRHGALSLLMSQLPKPDDMRALGWYIARLWGDLCPSCVAEKACDQSPVNQSTGDPA